MIKFLRNKIKNFLTLWLYILNITNMRFFYRCKVDIKMGYDKLI
jgi:hypothetical protein